MHLLNLLSNRLVDMQNEMVKVMALCILRKGSANLQSRPFYTIMVAETTDVSNKEQVVVCEWKF